MTERRIVQVGRLEEGKAPEVLLEAAAILSRDVDIELVFIGRSVGICDGVDYAASLRSRADSAGIRCKIVPHVPRDQLPALLSTARVVVIPSRFDNFPMVGLEAMAAARPIVCSANTGLAELINGSQAGVVVPPDDAVAIASAVRPMILDPVLAAIMGRNARELVAMHCSPEGIAVLREGVYADAIELWSKRGLGVRQY
jgi:glycosyltransferase involved in cell wall biosynthesis